LRMTFWTRSSPRFENCIHPSRIALEPNFLSLLPNVKIGLSGSGSAVQKLFNLYFYTFLGQNQMLAVVNVEETQSIYYILSFVIDSYGFFYQFCTFFLNLNYPSNPK
jgi:hypothetical protein